MELLKCRPALLQSKTNVERIVEMCVRSSIEPNKDMDRIPEMYAIP